MANILLGCDTNRPSEDRKNQKTIAQLLEKAGHTVEILSVGPNHTQSAMKQNSSKGKIAVMMCNGADLQTYKDFYQGITKGYYHAKYAYFALQGYISPKTCSCEGAKTAKLKKAHDDASSTSYTAELVGMTTHQVMEKYKSAIYYACGSSVEELGNNLVKVMNGGSNSSSSGSGSVSTIKSCIQELLYPWNGEAYCVVRDDTVHIGRIPGPTSTSLSIVEGVNVYFDSISVSDVDSEIPNKLIVKYGSKEYTIKDDVRISRFGEIKKEITADIKTETDIVDYAYREWNKLLKDSGRTLDCRVDGDAKWRCGKWARVYIPSFNLDGFMYVTKASHDDNGEWITTLTLKDYPPDLGTEPTDTGTSDSSSDVE